MSNRFGVSSDHITAPSWPRADALFGDVSIRIALAVFVLLLYGPSLRYGLIWDDPEWFARVAGARGASAFQALDGYGFFRPLTVLWHGAFVLSDGRVLDVPLHATQVMWHLGSTLMVHALARRWLPSRTGAGVAAPLFAALPFAQQSVAWAGAHQPPALFSTLLALALWSRHVERRSARAERLGDNPALRLGSIAAYVVALGLHESAAPLSIAIWFAELRPAAGTVPRRIAASLSQPITTIALRPPPHVALALLFVAWRATLPLSSSYVGGADFDIRSLGMLLQPIAWPVMRALALLPPIDRVARDAAEFTTAAAVVVVSISVWIALTIAVARLGRPRLALWAGVWIGLSIFSAWFGLSWSYLRHAPRLGYTASVGVALLWGALAGGLLDPSRSLAQSRSEPDSAPSSERRFQRDLLASPQWRQAARAATAITTAALLTLCAADTFALNRMHAAAAAVVDQATTAIAQNDALFINLPDRILHRRPPYPLGDWDVIALPVALDVGNFARARFGRLAPIGSEVSRFAPANGFDQREALPWWVDHRGEAASAEEIAALALDGRAVFSTSWSDTRPDTRFVGRLLAPSASELETAEAHWAPADGFLATGFGAGARAGSAHWPVLAGSDNGPGSTSGGTSGHALARASAIAPSSAALGEIQLRGAAMGGASLSSVAAFRPWHTHLWLLVERRNDAPPPDVTAFVHLFDAQGALIHTADGDAWDGLLPPSAWPVGALIVDVRDLGPIGLGSGDIRIGFYKRGGERLPAFLGGLDGQRAPEDAVRIEFQGSPGHDS